MSIKATKWANALPLNRNLKFLLVTLADHHNGKTGLCCPSQETLATRTCQSVDTVQRQLKILAQMNLITRERRNTSQGHRKSDSYQLNLAMTPASLAAIEQPADRGMSRATVYRRRRKATEPTPQDETLVIEPKPQNETLPCDEPTPQNASAYTATGAVYIDEPEELEREEYVSENDISESESLSGASFDLPDAEPDWDFGPPKPGDRYFLVDEHGAIHEEVVPEYRNSSNAHGSRSFGRYVRTLDAAHGQWRTILPSFGIHPGHLDGKHHPCPACGGKDRFRFTTGMATATTTATAVGPVRA